MRHYDFGYQTVIHATQFSILCMISTPSSYIECIVSISPILFLCLGYKSLILATHFTILCMISTPSSHAVHHIMLSLKPRSYNLVSFQSFGYKSLILATLHLYLCISIQAGGGPRNAQQKHSRGKAALSTFLLLMPSRIHTVATCPTRVTYPNAVKARTTQGNTLEKEMYFSSCSLICIPNKRILFSTNSLENPSIKISSSQHPSVKIFFS